MNELVFDFLFNLTAEQKKKFSPKELRAIRTAKRARQYVGKATIDEKLLMLAKLGVQFGFTLHTGNGFDTKEIKERYAKYKKMSQDKVISDMAMEKFVVVTERELVSFMSVMGRYSHSEAYLLNMDFHKVGGSINNWKRETDPDAEEIQLSLEHAKIINRFTLNVVNSIKTVKGDTDIADIDLTLLMFLYDRQNGYVDREVIELHYLGFYKKTVMTAAIKRLFEKVLIDRNPEKSKPEYQITALGIEAVMDFHRKNLSQSV